MSANEVILALLIHLVTPAAGLASYLCLCARMRQHSIPEPPYITFFFLFFALGAWLLVFLTALFWVWSGMASIGIFFLALVSPFIAAVLASLIARRRSVSSYHRWAFRLSLVYAAVVFAVDIIWLTSTTYFHT